MKKEHHDLQFLETPDGRVILGATGDLDWSDASGELVDSCLHIRKNKDLLFYDNLSKTPNVLRKIRLNKEVILSYSTLDGPQFTEIKVTLR